MSDKIPRKKRLSRHLIDTPCHAQATMLKLKISQRLLSAQGRVLLQLCSNCKFHLVIQNHKRSDLCLSKRDNVSRCIDLHQVLYIYVKMSIYVSRFTYTYQDPLASTSSLIYIDQLPSSYTDRQSNIISKFEYRHQDSHLYIKTLTYTARFIHRDCDRLDIHPPKHR